MPVRSGPRPKQANVPPFGFALNNDSCRNDTWCPAYQPGSIRKWPPLAAPAAPACPTTAATANASRVAVLRRFMVPPPHRMCGATVGTETLRGLIADFAVVLLPSPQRHHRAEL